MENLAYAPILRRTGLVLVAVGLVDIAAMVFSIVSGISYSSSLNVFAVVAGIFLIRGSLAAADHVRWFSVFFLAGFSALALALPFLQPVDLTLTQIRLSPLGVFAVVLLLGALLYLFFWLQRQLGSPPVQAALLAAGRKLRSMRVAAASGIGIVVVVAAVVPFFLGGESAMKAKSLAQSQLGMGYKYHLSSLSMATNGQGTSISARVTAWNAREVRVVPVEWRE